jgi:hypothetical protein
MRGHAYLVEPAYALVMDDSGRLVLARRNRDRACPRYTGPLYFAVNSSADRPEVLPWGGAVPCLDPGYKDTRCTPG